MSKEGIKPTTNKLKALKQAPVPTELSSLKAYLGLLNFYGNFIPNLSTEIAPLYNLTRKNVPLVWNDECMQCFERSKLLLSENSVVVQYNSSLPLGVVCDASPFGVGASMKRIKESCL